MPRRKGYGIPPTKRIKIENEPENDENEPNDAKSEHTRIDAQKSNNENCTLLDQAPSIAPENISNTLANATTNGSNKYLHKKFKKIVAILSDDCSPASSAVDQSNRVASSALVKDLTTCHNSSPPSTPAWAITTTAASSTITIAAAVAASSTTVAENHFSRQQQHASSINAPAVAAAAPSTTTMQSSLPKLASSAATRIDGKVSTTPADSGNHLSVTRDSREHSTSPFKSTTSSVTSEDDNVATVAAKCVCPYCDLVCSKPSVLEKHLRAHTNERPYPCLPCGFSFKTRSNLLKHCRTSRSHSLKLEEAGVENNMPVSKMLDEEGEDCEEDTQVSTIMSSTSTASFKDESSSNDENKIIENVPRAAIYKPKFHKAAIYIQNNNNNNNNGGGSSTINVTVSSSLSPGKAISGASEPSTMNKLGLQLKIPSSATTGAAQNSSTSSTPSTPSPFTSGSSPSPEFLHRHISKLISENQAIVETTDPFWSKKFYQRSKEGSPSSPLSNSSSSSVDSSFKKQPSLVGAGVKQPEHSIEDKLPVESKLAHALLQPRVVKAATAIVPSNETVAMAAASVAIEDAQPLNLSICKDTRIKSYLDEDDDKTAIGAEYRFNANDAARFVPNGRVSSAADLYVKEAHHGFVKAATLGGPCSLCDETFNNYDKLKTHILYECKGNKNYNLSSASINNHHTGVVNKPIISADNHNDTRVFLRMSSETAQQHQQAKPANLNQSPGPRLGNTSLVGGYKKLSVITTSGVGGAAPATLDKPTIKNNNHILLEHHKTVTSLKSLEELSKSPMKVANHFVYNAALIDDTDKSSSKVALADCKDDTKNSIISKTALAAAADDQKLISIKSASASGLVANTSKDSVAAFKSSPSLGDLATLSKTTSAVTPKISQFVIPVVQGVPNLATIQAVPAAALLAVSTNSDLHALSPMAAAAAYKTATTPTATLPKSKSIHVNGGVVTGILHGDKLIPYVPGIPGPQSATLIPVEGYEKKTEAVKRKYEESGPINGMIKHPNHQRMDDLPSPRGAKIFQGVKIKEEITSRIYMDIEKDTNGAKFARPSSLPLKPGTFVPKKLQPGTSSILPLISPETPRPNKSYGQLYIGGNAYTYLGLKCSTRSTFCTLHKSQPTYVPLSPEHNKVSMYSNWKMQSQNEMYARNEDGSRSKLLVGGIESTDEYTYIRGQGRGKYVCLTCGIRCKKPSMLKKHIRTHTDVRPYICKHCVFRFKTKGNLTKHMKSKAHSKKCMELGIVPVPTVVDDSYVDEEILSKQTQQIEEGQDLEETEDDDDDDDEDDDEENDDDYIEDKEAAEDPKCQLEREVARSLLSLSKMSHQTVSEQYANAGLVPLNARPNTYPYNFSANAHLSSKPHTPTLTLISEQKEQEKVSKNTGLARELQPIVTSNAVMKPKNESHTNERYYFGSAVDKEHVPMEIGDSASDIVVKAPSPVTVSAKSFVERCNISSGGISAKIETIERVSDLESKENVALTPTPEGEKAESSTSVIISVGSPNSNLSVSSPSKKMKAEFISPCSGPLTNVLEDGRSKCAICNKIFSKQSQLRLHVNIHYFEQPFRCESCAVSFRTRNNLQKHLGSNSHLNKVSMNSQSGGQTSTNNPRPFKCDDCNIGFRIHGHLAKHLRSKMHIMKLECLGKLPFGTYAEMERCGINMNDIDTTDCENSLESLQRIAKGVVNSVMYVNSAEEENRMGGPNSSF